MLSSEYVNTHCKLLWQCEHGHTWEASLNDVKNHNTWCPRCSKDKRKLPIDVAHRLAAERGGYILSSEYVNRPPVGNFAQQRQKSKSLVPSLQQGQAQTFHR